MKKHIVIILQFLSIIIVALVIYLLFNSKIKTNTEYYKNKIDSINNINNDLKLLYDSIYNDNLIKEDSINLLSISIDSINIKYYEKIKYYNSTNDSTNVVIFKEYLQKYRTRQY